MEVHVHGWIKKNESRSIVKHHVQRCRAGGQQTGKKKMPHTRGSDIGETSEVLNSTHTNGILCSKHNINLGEDFFSRY